MIFLTLTIVISLVFWALRLMDRAVENQEFSFDASRLFSSFICSGDGRRLFFDERLPQPNYSGRCGFLIAMTQPC